MVIHIFVVLLTELLSSPCYINHPQVWIKAKDPLNGKYGTGSSGRSFSPFGMFHLMYILFKKHYVKLSMLMLPINFCNTL